jgi:hypothetical protein
VTSLAAIREDVRDEAAVLYARAPWLDERRDGLLVEAAARQVVRLRRIDEMVDANPTQVLTTYYVRLETSLRLTLVELGLSPRAAADLGLVRLDAAERRQRLTQQTLDKYRGGDDPADPAKPVDG